MRRDSEDKLITVIAAHGGTGQSVFTLQRNVLCISPVLKDYLDHPDTVPPHFHRNGKGTLTFNTNGDVMSAALDHLKWKHDGRDELLRINEKGAVFHVQLYKMALCFGLDELCTAVLESLRIQAPCPDDFLFAAMEASRLQLIEEKNFRTWFTSYIRRRHEDLLKPLNKDDDASKLSSILVSTVAFSQPDSEVVKKAPSVSRHEALPATPPSSTARRTRHTESEFTLNDAKNVYRSAFATEQTSASDLATPTKTERRREKMYNSRFQTSERGLEVPSKKRKYVATVQDAVDEYDV